MRTYGLSPQKVLLSAQRLIISVVSTMVLHRCGLYVYRARYIELVVFCKTASGTRRQGFILARSLITY